MTRIAFTADLHVDSYGTRVDPETGLNARLLDYLTTTQFVAEEARRLDAQGLVIAGDYTERRHPAPWLVYRIGNALVVGPARQLHVRGNHDGEIAGGSIVNVFATASGWDQASRPLVYRVGDVAICAIPYLDRHWLRSHEDFHDTPDVAVWAHLAEQFLLIARALYVQATDAGAKATVLVAHQTLAGAHLSESQQAFLGDQQLVVPTADLLAIGYEGIVAGHLHRHQTLDADHRALYPGSVERVDFGEETEDKGFVVADVGPGKFDWHFIPTPARRFVTLTDPTIGEVQERAPGAVVRVRLSDPDADVADIRAYLAEAGAFDVTEIRVARREAAPATGLSEALAPEAALETYFADDEDREALVERGRGILAEVR